VLSHHVWQGTYGGDPSVVGSTFVVEGHPFTVVGITPPGFFGETLRGDPPDMWIPLQHEPMINGDNTMLRQPVSAWLRAIGRLRPGASTAGMAPRLTLVLRQWLQHDSGYPANWMDGVIRSLPKQTVDIVPAGAGVGVTKEQYGRSLQILHDAEARRALSHARGEARSDSARPRLRARALQPVSSSDRISSTASCSSPTRRRARWSRC
jgi:MacB-like periplasmic core domain